MSQDLTVLVATVLAATGSVVLAAEIFTRRVEIRTAFAWDVLETQYVSLLVRPRSARLVRRLVEGGWFDASVLARVPLAVAAVACTGASSKLAGLVALGMVALNVLLHARLLYGLDGSDQMSTIVWAGLALYWLSDAAWAKAAAIAFVAAQFALAYMTSGIAKAISNEWRSARALPAIFSSGNHGLAQAATLMRHRPMALIGCWTIILVETMGPTVALLNPLTLAVFVALSFSFHAGVALVMGLNLFLWSFLAGLVCFAWAATEIHRFL